MNTTYFLDILLTYRYSYRLLVLVLHYRLSYQHNNEEITNSNKDRYNASNKHETCAYHGCKKYEQFGTGA